MPEPANAQGGAQAFFGKSITATVNYQNRIRRNGQEFDAPMKFDLNLNISADGTVTGSAARVVRSGPRGLISAEPGDFGGDRQDERSRRAAALRIVVSGNTLTILRTFEVGGAKITINVQGGGRCTISAPVVREVGAGTTKRDHIVSGTVEVLSSRQVSSTCSVR